MNPTTMMPAAAAADNSALNVMISMTTMTVPLITAAIEIQGTARLLLSWRHKMPFQTWQTD